MYMNKEKYKLAEFRKTIPARQAELWTEDEEKDCIERFIQGEDISSLAMEYQRSEIAILKKLNSKGVCDYCKRPRQKNRPKCKCRDCSHYISGKCSGGIMCTVENPSPVN